MNFTKSKAYNRCRHALSSYNAQDGLYLLFTFYLALDLPSGDVYLLYHRGEGEKTERGERGTSLVSSPNILLILRPRNTTAEANMDADKQTKGQERVARRQGEAGG